MYDVVKMGLVPIGKIYFSHEDAKKYKALIERKLTAMGVRYVNIDSVVEDGIVRSYDDVAAVVEFMKIQKVDCIFMPHCNFGTESAAGLIGQKAGVPVLLWGPEDHAPLSDGTRLRDSLCGMFASSKVLNKLGVPFTYIENSDINSSVLTEGVDKFIRAVNVVKRLKGAKIGMIGNRIDFFWSTIIDESNLLHQFGIEILPMDLIRFTRMVKDNASANKALYIDELNQLKKELIIEGMTDDSLMNVLSARDVMLRWAKNNGLSALAIESFMAVTEELNACISYAQAACTDMGIPCACESDIHGAISSLVLEAAALHESPSFFADVTIKHPDNNNGMLLWHDSFPLSLKDPAVTPRLGTHWIIPNIPTGMCHWKLKQGDITISRFDGENGRYSVFAEKTKTIEGPFTQNTYVWVEVPDFRKLERKLIEGPYIHHTSCIYGDYVDVLREACKYIPGLTFDPV